MKFRHWQAMVCAIVVALGLAGCGGGSAPAVSNTANSTTPLSAGQVASPSAAPKVTHYAASRFAEQATFGPTPALVAELRAKGFEKWIDEQFALPFVPIDVAPAEAVNELPRIIAPPAPAGFYPYNEMMRLSLSASDQLHVRALWSLSQFIVVSGTFDAPASLTHWLNLLYRHSLGRYGELLRDVTISPMMGGYLNNVANRPKSVECPQCAPNENYARELMQLFSIGVLKLNPDGTPVRDARGRFVETYSQTDVEELARALTGWTWNPAPATRPARNYANWGKPMTPSVWAPERDNGRKEVMGRQFPAGQGQDRDLDDIVAMLMAHPNIAPFVALRFIQHLVMSDPSPAFVARVSGKFRDNGAGVAGDLKAVVKAVLLDPEARRGDDPAHSKPQDGKFREPWLHRMGMLRGMGCQKNLVLDTNSYYGYYWSVSTQTPFKSESVFGYYAPTDRAPRSNLLAPEQRLVEARELTSRLSDPIALMRRDPVSRLHDTKALRDAGCDFERFATAYARSPKEFIDLLSERYFRSALPPTLRSDLEEMISKPTWNANDPSEGPMRVLGMALATPTYGVVK